MGADSKGRNGLHRIDARTGEVTIMVLEEPRHYLTAHFDWSLDGKAFFYLDGNLVVEGLRTLQMHPDSQRIVFSAGKTTEQLELWVMENFLPQLRASR